MATNSPPVADNASADCHVDDAMLKVVWRQIGKQWKELGRELQISDNDLDDICHKHKDEGLREMAYQTIHTWKKAASTKATVSFLAATLQEVGRKDLRDEIMKIAANQKEEQSSLGAEWLKRLRSKLHEKYRKYVMKGLPWMGNIVITLAEYYVDLSVQTGDGNKKTTPVNNMKNPSNVRTGYSVAGKVEWQELSLNTHDISTDSSEEDESQHMVEVFQSAFSSHKRPLRVLVEGPPGYGKTTLSAKLCFDHAAPEDYLNNFDLVLHFSLRSFEGDLEEMLCRAAGLSDSHDREMFLKILENPSNRILLVLDGYDEVPQLHGKPILALLQGQRFPHVAVVVTSRPGHFTFERWEKENYECTEQRDLTVDWNGMWQSRITVLGVNKDMKALFIEKHLAGFPENIRSEVSYQLQQLEDNDIIESEFLKCPLFLLMIILLTTGDEIGGIRNLRTPTDLYKSVFNFIIRRYCAKQNEPANQQVDLFGATESPKPFYIELLCQFGEFALLALTNGKSLFSEDEVVGCQRDRNILDMGLLTKSVSTVGFMEKVVYEPVHKSLLEFSAAYTLWLQFPSESDLGSWAEKVICLWRGNKYEPFCLIMLAGLMRHRIPPALLDVFKPYAICGVWEQWLRRSVSEIEMTESILSSLTPFLPINWRQQDEEDCISRTQHDALLLQGIREGRIKRVDLTGFLATPMPDDVVVDTAVFWKIEDTVVNMHKFNCKHLLFRDSHVWRGLETWIPSTMKFQTLAFRFCSDVSSDLRLLRKAITVGVLKDIQIQIGCSLVETAGLVALTELIKMDKLKALSLDGASSGSAEALNGLVRAAANSSQLTTLHVESFLGVSVDLSHLCGGVQKTWQFLRLRKCNIDIPPPTDQTFQAKCLVLDDSDIPAMFRFLQVCQVTSLQCKPPLLLHIETLTLLHEHLTELNIIIDGTILNTKQCRLPHLPNLTILILTMSLDDDDDDDDEPRSFAVRDFLFGSRSFLRLQGIEIWMAGNNVEFSMEFLKCVSDCLEESIAVPTCEGRNKLRRFQSLQLEYFLMHSDYGHYHFLEHLGEMKAHLGNKSLSRIDIVTGEPCSPDLLYLFSPVEGFRVETDLWGTRSEDTIFCRMTYDTHQLSLLGLTQHLSLFNTFDRCYSIRHVDN